MNPIRSKTNQETLIWLYGKTGGPMARWVFEHLSLYASGLLIKYLRSSVAELLDSINIFVRVV